MLDRAEVRRRNLISAAQMPYATPLKTRGGMQVVLDSGDYPGCQQMALARIGWEAFPARQEAARREGRHLGIGLANFVEGTGRGPFEPVTVRIAPSGKVHVFSGAVAMGQSTKTMLAQIVAEQLGGDHGAIHRDHRRQCRDRARARRLQQPAGGAGRLFGASRRPARCARRRYWSPATCSKSRSGIWRSKALRSASRVLRASRSASPRSRAPRWGRRDSICRAGVTPGLEATEQVVIDDMTYSNGTAVVEVEVDVETGAVAIRNFVFAHDCGRVIHPMIVDGQIVGGVAHGIGNALFEWMGFGPDAQPLTTNLADYLLVTATELPRIVLLHQETPTPLNALGIKGVGEAGTLPTAAAIISAIEDALVAVRRASRPHADHAG